MTVVVILLILALFAAAVLVTLLSRDNQKLGTELMEAQEEIITQATEMLELRETVDRLDFNLTAMTRRAENAESNLTFVLEKTQ